MKSLAAPPPRHVDMVPAVATRPPGQSLYAYKAITKAMRATCEPPYKAPPAALLSASDIAPTTPHLKAPPIYGSRLITRPHISRLRLHHPPWLKPRPDISRPLRLKQPQWLKPHLKLLLDWCRSQLQHRRGPGRQPTVDPYTFFAPSHRPATITEITNRIVCEEPIQ